MPDASFPQFGRYRVIAELGRGAMGVVFKAEDASLGRTLAIKTILLSSDAEERAEYEARFYQEAKAAGGLNHPNIITIHDIGREGDMAYMAMELLDGIDLRELLKAGEVPLPLALELSAQVADGLGYAHEHGIVHRDIKPGNVMVVRGRHAKIMDFGIAKARVSDVKTQAGAILGTPKYMSPEQVDGVRTDHRSDIFSLGVTIYELVAGSPPFEAPDLGQLMHRISTVAPRTPTSLKPTLPETIDLILAKALEKDPDARYQSARELAADLRACKAEVDALSSHQPYEKTVKLNVPPPRPTTQDEATTTVRLEGAEAAPIKADRTMASGATAMPLPLARNFDGSRALQSLAAPRAPGNTGGPSLVGRVFADPLQKNVAIALFVAVLMAVAIAFF